MISYQLGLGGCFDTSFAVWVNGKSGIQNSIGNLITEFIWVSLAN
jgi:hypothetical protein